MRRRQSPRGRLARWLLPVVRRHRPAQAREGAFRGWFYDDDDDDYGDDDEPTAALGSQCAADRTEAECSRCANESAQVVPALEAEGRRKVKSMQAPDE